MLISEPISLIPCFFWTWMMQFGTERANGCLQMVLKGERFSGGGGAIHGVTQLLGQVGKLPSQKLPKILFRKFFMLKIGLLS